MKRASAHRQPDELRPEYDLSKLKGGVRGKYYRQALAGTNLVLIEPELAEVFPDTESVNRALRLLVDTAEAAAGPTRRLHEHPGGLLRYRHNDPGQPGGSVHRFRVRQRKISVVLRNRCVGCWAAVRPVG